MTNDQAASRLVVWRHATSEGNEAGIYQGSLDSPLTAIGRAEAEASASFLATMKPVAIVTSDLKRAVETARPLAQQSGVAATVDPRFRELDAGKWQGLTKPQIASQFPEELRDSLAGLDVRRGGGESMSELADRVRRGLDDIFATSPSGTVVVITHSVAARALVGALLGLGIQEWSKIGNIQNGKWSTLEQRLGYWYLASHNVSSPPPVTNEEDWVS